MTLLYQCSRLLPAFHAMEAGDQAALVAISMLVVVVSLAYAGYVLMRNSKDSRIEDQMNLGDFYFVSKNDLTTANKSDSQPAEGNESGRPTAATDEKAAIPLKISRMRIEPVMAKPGEMVTIWFDAINLDSSQIGYQVILKINERIFNVRQLSILPNTMIHLNFKVLISEPGSYTADVNGITGVFTIGR